MISGWSQTVVADRGQSRCADRSGVGAIYKGLAIASTDSDRSTPPTSTTRASTSSTATSIW